MSFALSHESFKELDFNSYPRDFTFIVGDKTFPCNRLIADFISPNVRKMHRSDITLDHYIVQNQKEIKPAYFKNIISLGEGNSIIPTDKNIKQISYFLKKLGNKEFSLFLKLRTDVTLNIDNCIETILLKEEIDESITSEISFIASNLYEIDDFSLKKLNVDLLTEILSNDSLCVKSEEWLFDFIFSRYCEDPKFGSLFEFVDFRFLSTSKFKDFIHSFRYDCLNSGIINAFMKRMSCDIVKPLITTKRYKMSESEHDFNDHNQLDGIIKYLTDKSGGNVAKNKTINITCSSVFSPSQEYSPENVVDLDTNSYFFSNCGPNQWICLDFKERKIIPKKYTLKSIVMGSNNHQPRNWVVEVSGDGTNWMEVDRREGNSVLNNKNVIGTFNINVHKKCRFIRFRLSGKTSYNTDYFVIAGIEVFGTIFER
ncbi:hypothetical protein TRFO_14205 [Tritrichomonas foetus]|uniref:F5/8 type C domain-containing protein n=1 Tax=Tritrichomonas foetus TaxID=1144522 RepID=A0A1J4L038_9EUKA|nr:hypothetical protein TRFO_14205 [Tritrichomonas foetus]|eukprot:OHT15300.1 hypothetical protein TRFO_14205 [Tritrichomonas foetus]